MTGEIAMEKDPRETPLTDLLNRWAGGDKAVEGELFRRVQGELEKIAHKHLAMERNAETLETRIVVNEAYAKIKSREGLSFPSRNHFYAFMATVIRNFLYDYARMKDRDKRWKESERAPEEALAFLESKRVNISRAVDIHTALHRLELESPETGRIMHLHYFGGMTQEEIAEFLEIGRAKVTRRLRLARRWMARELQDYRPQSTKSVEQEEIAND